MDPMGDDFQHRLTAWVLSRPVEPGNQRGLLVRRGPQLDAEEVFPASVFFDDFPHDSIFILQKQRWSVVVWKVERKISNQMCA